MSSRVQHVNMSSRFDIFDLVSGNGDRERSRTTPEDRQGDILKLGFKKYLTRKGLDIYVKPSSTCQRVTWAWRIRFGLTDWTWLDDSLNQCEVAHALNYMLALPAAYPIHGWRVCVCVCMCILQVLQNPSSVGCPFGCTSKIQEATCVSCDVWKNAILVEPAFT